MCDREINILKTVFKDYFIYVDHRYKTAKFNNGIELDYEYIDRLYKIDVLRYYIDLDDMNRVYSLNINPIEGNLLYFLDGDIEYAISGILHIYREQEINKII